MRAILLTATLILAFSINLLAQENQKEEKGDIEDLKKEILSLKLQQDQVMLNLNKYRKRFNFGLIMATVGYTTVVAGGQLLGGKNDDLGSAMLYIGGALGITGTVVLIDAGKFMKRATNPPPEPLSYN